MKRKRKIVYILSIVAIITLTSFATLKINLFLESKREAESNEIQKKVLIEYGDQFPDFDYLEDVDGDEVSLPSIKNDYQIVIYVSEGCVTCKEAVKSVGRASQILGNDKVDIVLLWKDNIPKEYIEKYDLNNKMQFSLCNKVDLDTLTPTLYLLDNKGKVIYTDYIFENVIKKLMVSSNNEEKDTFIKNANKYLIDNYIEVVGEKEKVIFFSTNNCEGCSEADEIISENNFGLTFDVMKVLPSMSGKNDEIMDDSNILKSIYNIKEYPSFVLIDDNKYQILGNLSIEELEELRMKYNE